MSSKSNLLEKAKKQHFDMLKKNNAVTDAKNGELSLGAMKSLDIILNEYNKKLDKKIQLELSYLRKKLGLEKNNDYVDRIRKYLLELKLPFELRNFQDIKTGKQVEWALTSFIQDVKAYKETQHIVEINISESFIDYMIDRAGYTLIDLSISKKFKTKYGYKIYEMYLRYFSMPNKIDSKIGTIEKDIDELNSKFGTKHKHASKMMEGINRGLKEILTITGDEIYCFYAKDIKKFVFSWEKNKKQLESPCLIPLKRVDELVEWVILHSKNTIQDISKYKRKIKRLILNNDLENLESSYRGMLKYKYEFSSEEMDAMKMSNGKYKDFSKKAIQKTLFGDML